MKKINLFLVYFVSFLYMEILYKIVIYHSFFNMNLINMIFFLLSFSAFLFILSKLFKEKVNKIIYIAIMVIISIWFCAQYVVKSYFDFYISLSTFLVADQVGDFFGKAVVETFKRIPLLLIFFIPTIIGIIFSKKINFKRANYKVNIIYAVLTLLFIGIFSLTLLINKKDAYSPYNLFYNVNDVALNIEKFGIINSFIIDSKRTIIGFEENVTLNNNLNNSEENIESDVPVTYLYNNLDIDFDDLATNESNKTIKKIHEYMASDSGTLQNKYTGMFEGKNLILFMAESFNEIAIDETLTPTLYKLANSGFVFENFYTPTLFSTIGGEFQELTGLYAASTNVLKAFRNGKLSFPQGIGNVFNNIDYKTYAYHNNSYSFQDRNQYLKSLGLGNFKACYNGLEKLINCKEWPQSDVAMINATIDDYANEDNFMVFYASVSGHSSYNWGNASAKKHKEEYLSAGYNYSTAPASYMAAQMELDRALELLIKKLEEKGILEDTVIALVGDHYPYELTIDEINEVSTYKRDDVVEVNRSKFILWNSEMDTIKINKVGSQIDVIPTLYNLFGIKYDSRLFIGKDILSTEGGLAMFGNRSWVSDKGTYFSRTSTFVPKENVNVDEEYVNMINQIVNNKITMSRLIIENNYYQKVMK